MKDGGAKVGVDPDHFQKLLMGEGEDAAGANVLRSGPNFKASSATENEQQVVNIGIHEVQGHGSSETSQTNPINNYSITAHEEQL